MEPLSEAIRRRLERGGMAQAVSAAMIVQAAKRILPPPLEARTFRAGTLSVDVPTDKEAYFLSQEEETYRERVNAALDKPVVERIRFRIKHHQEPRAGPES